MLVRNVYASPDFFKFLNVIVFLTLCGGYTKGTDTIHCIVFLILKRHCIVSPDFF
jgi:hypothetical protein